MSDDVPDKVGVSVSEMARMVGLSRARFYQLQRAGVFPAPLTDAATQRPYYDAELQQVCLDVRKHNCGVNGKPILFYARRLGTPGKTKPPKPKLEAKRGDVATLLAGLNALGLTTATGAQVQQEIEELYPQGTTGLDQGDVLRSVFLSIRRRNSADNVSR